MLTLSAASQVHDQLLCVVQLQAHLQSEGQGKEHADCEEAWPMRKSQAFPRYAADHQAHQTYAYADLGCSSPSRPSSKAQYTFPGYSLIITIMFYLQAQQAFPATVVKKWPIPRSRSLLSSVSAMHQHIHD